MKQAAALMAVYSHIAKCCPKIVTNDIEYIGCMHALACPIMSPYPSMTPISARSHGGSRFVGPHNLNQFILSCACDVAYSVPNISEMQASVDNN